MVTFEWTCLPTVPSGGLCVIIRKKTWVDGLWFTPQKGLRVKRAKHREVPVHPRVSRGHFPMCHDTQGQCHSSIFCKLQGTGNETEGRHNNVGVIFILNTTCMALNFSALVLVSKACRTVVTQPKRGLQNGCSLGVERGWPGSLLQCLQ